MKRSFFPRRRRGSFLVFRISTFVVFATAFSPADEISFSSSFLSAVATHSSLFAADGSCLWGTADEKTTYSPPYYSNMAPNIPVVTRPEAVSETTPNVPAPLEKTVADFKGQYRESGTLIGADGNLYAYSYVRGVQPFRETTSTWVQETPPGGLFPIWVEKKTSKIVWKPVLIKQLRPITETASPAPCVPVGVSPAASVTAEPDNSSAPVHSSVQ